MEWIIIFFSVMLPWIHTLLTLEKKDLSIRQVELKNSKVNFHGKGNSFSISLDEHHASSIVYKQCPFSQHLLVSNL